MTSYTDPTNLANSEPAADPGPIYCVKCKAKTANANLERVTMKNGRPARKATCVDCGTNKFRIGG